MGLWHSDRLGCGLVGDLGVGLRAAGLGGGAVPVSVVVWSVIWVWACVPRVLGVEL